MMKPEPVRSDDPAYAPIAPWTGLPVPLLLVPPTPLIGRRAEVETVIDLLSGGTERLVTLTGPGGIGKTRLAIEIAHRLASQRRAPVVFVSLASLPRARDVIPAILRTIGLNDQGHVEPLAALTSALLHSELLLVLDNFEHVQPAAPEIAELLAAAPQVRFLVTSRSRLRLRGEHNVPLLPLGLPDDREMDRASAVRTSEAVRLFVERAAAAGRDVTPTDADLLRIATICRKLDGLPLAIELAAARSTHLSLAQLDQRLDRRLPLLTGGPSDLPVRHRTLRDTIAWSYALLGPGERTLFRRLAVFHGGFTLEAIEAISDRMDTTDADVRLAGAGAPEPTVVDQLGALVDASLVRHDTADTGESRYDLPETIREYADELLTASAEVDALREQHARWFLAMAGTQEAIPFRHDTASRVLRVLPAHANIMAALDWFEVTGDGLALGQLTAAMGWIWWHRGEWRAGRPRLERVWNDAAIHQALTVQEFCTVGISLGLILFTETIDGARAISVLSACVERSDAASDARPSITSRIGLGWLFGTTGDLGLGLVHLRKARELAERLPPSPDAHSLLGIVLNNLGTVLRWSGRLNEADGCLQEARGLLERLGDSTGLRYNQMDQGFLARDMADYPLAASLFRDVLRQTSAWGDRRGLVGALEGLATVAVATDHLVAGTRLLGVIERERQSFGMIENNHSDRLHWDTAFAMARSVVGDEAYERARRDGMALPFDQAIAEALQQTGTPPRTSTRDLLTGRETEIMRLLSSGQSNREIAEALFVGERTVESHLSRIYDKLGVRSRTAAVAAASARGLIRPIGRPDRSAAGDTTHRGDPGPQSGRPGRSPATGR